MGFVLAAYALGEAKVTPGIRGFASQETIVLDQETRLSIMCVLWDSNMHNSEGHCYYVHTEGQLRLHILITVGHEHMPQA